MPEPPAVPDPGRDQDPARDPGVPSGPASDRAAGWRRVPDRPEGPDVPHEVMAAWLDAEACDLEVWEDYPGPEEEEDLEDSIAEWRQAAEEQAVATRLAAEMATPGELAAWTARRRGPGQPGSARPLPGEYTGKAAEFAVGMPFDLMPGGPELAVLADRAAGAGDCFAGASDDELAGVLCAWDRVEAHAAARKLAAVAELIRRRPEPGCELEGPARMPVACEEFAAEELAMLLAVSRREAGGLLGLAHDLAVKLPGTAAALRAGTVTKAKASIMAWATALLDPAEAQAAEELVLGRVGKLTPGGLRAAIGRAVMEVDADKARARREAAAAQARVQRWAEDSGNAALEGRELPPADVLAADQRVTSWARQLRAAGLDGNLDQLRATAYLDILLSRDSRPRQGEAPPDGALQDRALQ
ncbi:MAG: DUF222 domain-containing protein, partial [Actinobacteria bacterium]|nr:DUF222 domain-containing protein [Actinomycetota bacterium]